MFLFIVLLNDKYFLLTNYYLSTKVNTNLIKRVLCVKSEMSQVLKRTKCIVLNSLDQNITDIKLKQKDGTLLMTEDFSFVS